MQHAASLSASHRPTHIVVREWKSTSWELHIEINNEKTPTVPLANVRVITAIMWAHLHLKEVDSVLKYAPKHFCSFHSNWHAAIKYMHI